MAGWVVGIVDGLIGGWDFGYLDIRSDGEMCGCFGWMEGWFKGIIGDYMVGYREYSYRELTKYGFVSM